jgi:hypothetical protein
LLDLIHVYGSASVWPEALAALQEHAARGAEARQRAEARRQAEARAGASLKLAAARRRLIGLLRQRAGLGARPEAGRLAQSAARHRQL